MTSLIFKDDRPAMQPVKASDLPQMKPPSPKATKAELREMLSQIQVAYAERCDQLAAAQKLVREAEEYAEAMEDELRAAAQESAVWVSLIEKAGVVLEINDVESLDELQWQLAMMEKIHDIEGKRGRFSLYEIFGETLYREAEALRKRHPGMLKQQILETIQARYDGLVRKIPRPGNKSRLGLSVAVVRKYIDQYREDHNLPDIWLSESNPE